MSTNEARNKGRLVDLASDEGLMKNWRSCQSNWPLAAHMQRVLPARVDMLASFPGLLVEPDDLI